MLHSVIMIIHGLKCCGPSHNGMISISEIHNFGNIFNKLGSLMMNVVMKHVNLELTFIKLYGIVRTG